jgi:hypothetical protein
MGKVFLLASLIGSCLGLAQESTSALLKPNYAAGARIEIAKDRDVYVNGSVLYWQAMEENLDLGHLDTSYIPTVPVSFPRIEKTIDFDFQYRPGFKLAAGMNLDRDQWDIFSEYTWYHTGDLSTSTNAVNAIIYLSVKDANITNHVYDSAKSVWNLKMDFLDLLLARTYQVGTHLSFRTLYGIRGAWIRQRQTSTFASHTTAHTSGKYSYGYTNQYYNKSISWGVGLKTGLETNWLLGHGIRIFGNGFVDILFTQYDLLLKQKFFETFTGTVDFYDWKTETQKGVQFLRSHLDLELGLGYGFYFSKNERHIDLSAGYGFQVFWDQNMFLEARRIHGPQVDLFLQGLTVTGRVDF